MADQEQLARLKRSVEEWNAWRKNHPDVKIDLEGADLRLANLKKAKLGGSVLIRANLNLTDLSGADLKGANLSGANLVLATLDDGRGNPADLTNAVMTNAVMTRPEEGDAEGSFLDLAAVKGLHSIDFGNPSFLPNYLERAFKYVHQSNLRESEQFPNFVESVLRKITLLRKVIEKDKVPEELVQVVQTITQELVKYLGKHPEALRTIKPRQFEELIAEILASYGWRVQLTPESKDGGYDIYAISKDLSGVENHWIIECKKYASHRKVGVNTVRSLYGVGTNLRVGNMMLATTSDFTKGVKDFKASRYDMDLRNYESVLDWVNTYEPNPNGKLYIKDNKLMLPGKE